MIVQFICRAILLGVPLLYGSTGEIVTEKSGHLNLGIPGIMYVGAISGVVGSFLYENSCGNDIANMNPLLAVLIPLLCTLAGSALMGIGRASGENRAVLAAQQAIESPLIEVKIEGAKGVLFSVAGGYDMSMSEIQEAAEVITGAVAPDANIIFGASIRPELEDEIVITVVATGFDSDYYKELERQNIGATIDDNTEGATVADAAAVVEDTSSKEPTVAGEDFAKDNRRNMWDSIRTEESEEDLDVPPSLRAKFRRKK